MYIGEVVEVHSGDDHYGCDCGDRPQHTDGGNYHYDSYHCAGLVGTQGETLTKTSATFEYCSMCEQYTEAPVRLEGKLAHKESAIRFWVCEWCATEVRTTSAHIGTSG
jgi:hypothetical protein